MVGRLEIGPRMDNLRTRFKVRKRPSPGQKRANCLLFKQSNTLVIVLIDSLFILFICYIALLGIVCAKKMSIKVSGNNVFLVNVKK